MTDNLPATAGSDLDRKAANLAADGEDFATLLDQVEGAVDGRRVVKTEDLRGVPFIITGVRFQAGKGGDFLSLECTAADDATLVKVVNQGRTHAATPDFLPVVGNERFVINDSSTGIRRQIVKYLADTGRILINPDWDPAAHDKADVYDQPLQDKNGNDIWLGGVQEALEGIRLRYLCARGTRVSEYDYQGDRARTVYLA